MDVRSDEERQALSPEQWRRVVEILRTAGGGDDAEQQVRESAAHDAVVCGVALSRLRQIRLGQVTLEELARSAEPASRIGPYAVRGEAGRGGMGIVYRAHDERLDREVALKCLPDAVARDADRLERFEREAKLLASLHHSNIATVYGLEESNGTRFLVMEFVDGETLAEHLARGVPPIDEALAIAGGIARGVEAAHAGGVIHRDLKPANVKLTPDGAVKVLDFGLAKAIESTQATTPAADAPTVPAGGSPTIPGVILGTAGYMSPEQARGKPVNAQTDVWSLGCVLYELLTGRCPFVGATPVEAIASTLTDTPDFDALPAETPPTVRLLLRRCLERECARRWQSVGDVRIELEAASEDPSGQALGLRAAPAKQPSPVVHLSLSLPEGLAIPFYVSRPFTISADGMTIVFIASGAGVSKQLRPDCGQLYVRRLDEPEPRVLPRTEDGFDVCLSPDGRFVSFMREDPSTRRDLLVASLESGTVERVPGVRTSRGAVWVDHETLLVPDMDPFRPPETSSILRAPIGGGPVQPVTEPDPASGDRHHEFPELLPDGSTLLHASYDEVTGSHPNIVARSLRTGEHKVLLRDVRRALYARSGHLVYSRSDGLFAVPFDARRVELTGPEALVIDGIRRHANHDLAAFALSESGTLLYIRGRQVMDGHTLEWVDEQGRTERCSTAAGLFYTPRMSPDGRRLSMSRLRGNDSWDLWVLDVERDVLTRVTFGEWDGPGIWTPDGARIAFATNMLRRGCGLAWAPADGSGEVEPLLVPETGSTTLVPTSFAPDGSRLVFSRIGRDIGAEIWELSMDGERRTERLIRSPRNAYGAMISPDGRWIAYISDESGRPEVFLRGFPDGAGRVQVSTEGGTSPAWSGDGSRLFYRAREAMMAVDVGESGPSPPRLLFETASEEYGTFINPCNYAVSPHGDRFVMVQGSEGDWARIDVIQNWHQELRQRAPAR
ncbi:MAG: protein kinase domain-containing protein [Planctomycetota bacterium]|jgi:serine/threonine-protein kinase